MEENKVEIPTKKITSKDSIENNKSIDNDQLSFNELIARVSILSEDKSPYTVSREIEEIKSIFYMKLKNKDDKISEDNEDNIINELDPLEIKFKSVFRTYRKIKSEFRKKREKEELNNLTIKKQIIEDIDVLAKQKESIKITFDNFKSLQEKWKTTGHVPITENNHLWESYHHHVELFYDFIKLNNDLRDLDFKRNLEEKNKICKKAITLLKEKSVNKAHDNLQELHEHWKNIGPVKREKREEIWKIFQDITRKINKNRNDYFLDRKNKDSEILEEKNKICTKINNLTNIKKISHKEWQEAKNECSKLEEKWRKIGGLGKENNKLAWKKLRASLTKFYDTINAFYKHKKNENKLIIETKLSICKRAENLQNSTNWQETGKMLMQLQEEWKNSKFLPASQSNEIWKSFKNACDKFFKARKLHYKKIEEIERNAYQEKKLLVKQVEGFKSSSDTKKDINTLKGFSLKWKNIGHVPREKMSINDNFFDLLNHMFGELGLSEDALATEKYKNKINAITGDNKKINSEQQYVKANIATLKKEIIQYENNISFFGSGIDTKPLLEQAQQKIDYAKSEIEDLKQKMQLLNKA